MLPRNTQTLILCVCVRGPVPLDAQAYFKVTLSQTWLNEYTHRKIQRKDFRCYRLDEKISLVRWTNLNHTCWCLSSSWINSWVTLGELATTFYCFLEKVIRNLIYIHICVWIPFRKKLPIVLWAGSVQLALILFIVSVRACVADVTSVASAVPPPGLRKRQKDAPRTPGRCPGANGDEKSWPSLVKCLKLLTCFF
jgi:hypothetical protein